jgi:hypothetical protein
MCHLKKMALDLQTTRVDFRQEAGSSMQVRESMIQNTPWDCTAVLEPDYWRQDFWCSKLLRARS